MNRRIFETYVTTQLAPTLEKGDVVILDNLAAHKSPVAEKAIRARGAWLLFLPPYSPDPESMYGWLLRVKDVGSVLMNRSVAAMYTASEYAAASLRALMNVRLGEQVPLNRARSERCGLIGVSWFFVSVRSPSPHVALTIPLADQAAACD